MKTRKPLLPTPGRQFSFRRLIAGVRLRSTGSRSLLPLLAGVGLLACVGNLQAQFPVAPENEHTQSIAGIRIDTTSSTLSAAQLSALFDQGTALAKYPGWIPPFLTSPLLYDSDTRIAVGGVTRRSIFNYNGNLVYPLGFPQTVGLNGISATGLPLTPDTILGYGDYLAVPMSGDFSATYAAGAGPRECLTEIQAINLYAYSACSNGCTPQLACGTYPNGADKTMVRAGYNNIFNQGAPFDANYTPRSIGMVDAISLSGNPANDFPANSFFGIYPEITLPPADNTMSIGIIPLSGAVLTTAGVPLIIESQNIPGPQLPPEVVYIHQTSDFGVDLVFRDTGPINPGTSQPYWSVGDVLGTLTFAGHYPGVSDPCAKGLFINTLVNAVFGPPGQLAPSAVVGLLFTNTTFPPNLSSSLATAPGTNFDGSSLDMVQFTNGVTTQFVRNFSFSSFLNPTSMPSFGNSTTYTNQTTAVTLELSTDGHNWLPGAGTCAVQIVIFNTNPPTAPSKVYYNLQLKSFTATGSSAAGSFKFRQNPTNSSLGLHIVQTNGSGSYKEGGYINTSFQESFNGGATYVNANRSIQLKEKATVDCGSVRPLMSIVMVSPGIGKITWNSTSYRLQSSTSLSPPVWASIPVTSPYLFNFSPTNRIFFRLVCP